MLFTSTFDWIFAAIMLALAIVFLLGKGGKILDAFSGKSTNSMRVEKKKSPEQQARYQRIMGIFCLILAIDEMFLALTMDYLTWAPYVSIAVVIADLILFVVYVKKYIGN